MEKNYRVTKWYRLAVTEYVHASSEELAKQKVLEHIKQRELHGDLKTLTHTVTAVHTHTTACDWYGETL